MIGPRTVPHVSDIQQIPDLMTVAEAAKALRLNPRTVERGCARGQFPAVKVGRRWRIRSADLAAFLHGVPALRPELDELTQRGQPRQRRAPLNARRSEAA